MIGILSGAGPLAGFDVAKKIIEETKANVDQEHLPVLVFSIPDQIPDRSAFLLGRETRNPGLPMGKLFLALEAAGASVAAIACNTAHAPSIFVETERVLAEAQSSLQIINLIELTSEHLRETCAVGAKVGVLSTDGTRRLGLYRNALEKRGFEVIEADDALQPLVQGAIYDLEFGIKAQSSPVDPRVAQALETAMTDLVDRGATVLVLGCTELPLAISARTHAGCPVIDPNRLLARKFIELYAPEKLR